MTCKPLNGKAYGSIPHLPGSKFGNRDDKGVDEKAARFFLEKAGKKDRIIVLEKVDGTCVSVANINGEIVPLIRAGFPAISSSFFQHRLFAMWVFKNLGVFQSLNPGERICGEWLAQAHGTLYDLQGRSPFVAFDLFRENERQPYPELMKFCDQKIQFAPILIERERFGITIEEAMESLGELGHYGAKETAEGCVWRWERDGWREDPVRNPIMMAKFVRQEKEPGKYLGKFIGDKWIQFEPTWNMDPVILC